LPDASLYGEMEQPSGQLPQFLVLSEIQRRTDMRERYEATQEQPQGTISDQIISEGLGGMMPDPMTMGSQTMGSPIPTDPTSQVPAVAAGTPPPPTGGMAIGASGLAGMGGQPQGMASGGIIGMSNGGAPYSNVYSQPWTSLTSSNPASSTPAMESALAAGRGEGRTHLVDPAISGWWESLDQGDEYEEARQKFLALVEQFTAEGYNPRAARIKAEEVIAAEDEVVAVAEEAEIGEINRDALFGSLGIAETESLPQTEVDNITAYEPEDDYVGGGGQEIIGETASEALIRQLEGTLPTDYKVETGVETEGLEALPDFTTLDPDQTGLLGEMEATRTGLMGRLDTRRTQSQDLIEQIREEGRRDAFSAAMMQLGAGVAGGDMSGGLQRAGEAATSINALARDAARAEGRGLRDYEEAALTQSDLMGLEAEKFKYGEAKERQVTAQEQARWDADHGLREDSLRLESLFKNAGLEAEYAKLKSDQILKVAEIGAKAKSDLALTRREAMRLFSSYMGDIQDIAEDMPLSGTSEDDKMKMIRGMQKQILDALSVDLGSDFLKAFEEEAEAEAAGGETSETVIDYTELL